MGSRREAMRKVLTVVGMVIFLLCFYAIPVLAAVPTVTNSNASVDGTSVTLNGDITATGVVGDDDIRGFVWDDMTSHANPGNVAPGASGYSDNWTEAGSFNTGEFTHEVTGLTSLLTHYYRACAHSADGWAYSDEITFFSLVDDKVYLEFRPDLDETRIRGNAGIPTDAIVGIYSGYSMPIWNAGVNVNEELYLMHCVPDRWDNDSDPAYGSHILVHIKTSLANANESGNSYTLQMAWDHASPNEESIPIDAPHITTVTREIYSDTQYEHYQDWLVILYNADAGDDIAYDDTIAIRVRRIASQGKIELDGELIINSLHILYARGDLLGDPVDGITGILDTLIAIGYLVGGEGMYFLVLALLALGLTIAMFATRNLMLGFPSAIFWAVLGGYAYTEFITAWVDWQYYLFFASMGMVIFCVIAMFGLRKQDITGPDDDKERYFDEEPEPDLTGNIDKPDGEYNDEGKGAFFDEPKPSKRVKAIRARATKRRTG